MEFAMEHSILKKRAVDFAMEPYSSSSTSGSELRAAIDFALEHGAHTADGAPRSAEWLTLSRSISATQSLVHPARCWLDDMMAP